MPDIAAMVFPAEKTFATSLFREELSHIGLDNLLAKVRQVVDMMTDSKSKITYLLTWLSLLLLDKDIFSVYFQSAHIAFQQDGRVHYHGLDLAHITDPILQYNLFLKIYKMEHVTPAPGDIVLDIGAYRGDTAAFFRKYVGENGRVFAFEPDETNFQFLVENIEKNRLANVVPVKKALLDKAAHCRLISTPKSSSFIFIVKETSIPTPIRRSKPPP